MKINCPKGCSNVYFWDFRGGGHFWRVTPQPNTNGFALQWNIGLTVFVNPNTQCSQSNLRNADATWEHLQDFRKWDSGLPWTTKTRHIWAHNVSPCIFQCRGFPKGGRGVLTPGTPHLDPPQDLPMSILEVKVIKLSVGQWNIIYDISMTNFLNQRQQYALSRLYPFIWNT